MPRRPAHQAIGAIAGGATALVRARQEEPLNCFVETLGGVFAGYHAGPWPDILDAARCRTPPQPRRKPAAWDNPPESLGAAAPQ